MTEPVLEIPFTGGIDEASREEHARPGVGWVTLQNGRCNKLGAYEKRLAYAALGKTYIDATTRSAGYRMLSDGERLCVIDGTYIDVYSAALGRSVVNGRVAEALVSVQGLPTMGAQFSGVEDVTFCNGYIVAAYMITADTDFGSYTAVLDPATGAVLRRDLQVLAPTVVGSRLARYGNYVFSFSPYTSGNDIFVQYIDLTSAATIAAGWVLVTATLTAADFADGGFDVAEMASNDRVAVAYGALSSSGERITVKTLNISGVIESVNIATGVAMTNTYGVGLSEGASTLWVTWVATLAVKALGLNPTDIDGTALATAATVMTLGGAVTQHVGVYIEPRSVTGTAAVFVSTFAATQAAWTVYSGGVKTLAGVAASDGITNVVGSAVLGSRPFLRSERFYAHVASPRDEDGTLCDVTPNFAVGYAVSFCRPVAAAVQRGLFANSPFGRRQRSAAIDSNRYAYGLTIRRSGTTFGNALATYDFASPYRWRPAKVTGTTYLGGGVTSIFDGVRLFEAGFLVAPQVPTTDNTTGTGLNMTYGRKYVVTYEEVDANGNWHVSGASTPCAISGAQTNKACVVTVHPISITSRISLSRIAESSLRVVLYATLDGNNGEEPYHRVGSVLNNPNAAALTFSDTTSDPVLASKALLYSTGNLPATGASQDHRAPPGMPYIVGYNGMLVGAQGRNIYYSSQPIDGEGPWFSPLFAQAIEGEATGIAVQDGSVVVFTRSSVFVCAGEPPSDNAYQGGLGTPRKLSVDFGCIDANSILETGIGIFYQSQRGIELLTRGFTVEPVGVRIQDTLASFPVVTSAVLDVAEGLARFSLTTARTAGVAATNGRDVIYDLALNTWISRDVKVGTVAAQSTQDACMAYVSGAWRYCWLGTDGAVYYQRSTSDVAAYLDTATWVAQKAVSPWLHIAGLQGEQFIDGVLLLAKQFTGHELTISLAFDYVDSNTETQTWTRAGLDTLAREWLHRGVTQTTSQAVRVTIEDATPATGLVGTGQGGAWIALTLNGQPHRGAKRTAPGHRGGT